MYSDTTAQHRRKNLPLISRDGIGWVKPLVFASMKEFITVQLTNCDKKQPRLERSAIFMNFSHSVSSFLRPVKASFAFFTSDKLL